MLNSVTKKTFVLIAVYLGFIGYGFSDRLLSIAWPTMRIDFSQNLDMVGVLVFINSILSAIAGFSSAYFVRKHQVSNVLIASFLLVSLGLLGFGFANSWAMLILVTLPLGFGGGLFVSLANNYAAKYYTSRQMNWLHGSYGIGASFSAAIMTFAIVSCDSWRYGYFIVVGLLSAIIIFFISTRNMWKPANAKASLVRMFLISTKNLWIKLRPQTVEKTIEISPPLVSFIPVLSMLTFFFYVSIEGSIGFWFYSVLVEERGVGSSVAGSMVVVYWSFLTIGRFLIGIFSNKLGNRKIVSYGLMGAFFSLLLLLVNNNIANVAGLALVGFCLSGIYPCMMHETPKRVGKLSTTLIGFQAGMSSLGVAILVPLIGVFIDKTSLIFFIPVMLIVTIAVIIMNRILNKYS